MASKGLVMFGVLLVTLLLVSSEVVAGVQAQQTPEEKANKASVEEQKGRGGYNGPGQAGYEGGGCRCCGHGHHGGCRCCKSPDEVPEPEYIPEVQHSVEEQKGRSGYNKPGEYGGGGGHGGCRCCGHGYHGGCRCCKSPNEVPEPQYIPEVQH